MAKFSMERHFLFILLFAICTFQCDRPEEVNIKVNTPFLQIDAQEVEHLLKEMSLDEKFGQLIFLDTDLNKSITQDSLYKWSNSQLLGGLVLRNTSVRDYIRIIDRCKANAKSELLTGTWERVNMNNHFKSLTKFPSPASFASVGRDSIAKFNRAVYKEQKTALNLDFIFGPELNPEVDSLGNYNLDLNSNDLFTELKYDLRELKENNNTGILSIGNSFHDHLEIEIDSFGIKSKVLQKYYNLSMNGLQALLVKPDLFLKDSLIDRPMDYIKTYLFDEINFDGLVFSKLDQASQLEDAIYAGTDVFIIDKDPKSARDTLMSLFKNGFLTEELLNDKVARVMKAKEWINKQKRGSEFDHQMISEYIGHSAYERLTKELYESSICVLRNNGYLPLKHLESFEPHFHFYTNRDFKIFNSINARYSNADKKTFHKKEDAFQAFPDSLNLKQSTKIIVLDGINLDGDHAPFIESINKISKTARVVILNFGNPLNFKWFTNKVNAIQVFEHNETTERALVEILYGARVPKGISQVQISPNFRMKARSSFSKRRLAYTDPEALNIDPLKLKAIDSIMLKAIKEKAIPGGQILVAKDGAVFYSKSFGYHTYDKKQTVKNSDLYDLASLSKICGTTLGVMKLYDQRKIALNDKLSKHISMIGGSKMRKITLSNLLLHRSNLQPNMPIKDYVFIADSILADCDYKYCNTKRNSNDIKIADDFYFNKAYQDSLWLDVLSIKPYKQSKYRYSDVNFNLLQKVLEKKTHQSLDKYCSQHFYDKMGLTQTLYKPLTKFNRNKIAPTELDKNWRKQLLDGYVHDEYASLQGGVSGSAGLFSSAEELAVICQMLLNKGQYGGTRFLNPKTVDLFTSKPLGSKRGLGFDKPRGKYTESCSAQASDSTFGHSGFTGTCIWIDPESQLIYIFLSNRIHPSINNKKLFRDKYRGKIHTAIYDALDTYHPIIPGQIKEEVSQIEQHTHAF